MRISILTLFPDMFGGVLNESILKRAQQAGILNFALYDIRDFAVNKHRQVDDYPFGGGAGMLLMPQPVFECFEKAQADGGGKARRIYMSPKGKKLDTPMCKRLAQEEELIILCGHYEGVDQRIIDHLIDEEISIGDFVLTGGEIPAMALVDSVARQIPGVLGSAESIQDESFTHGLLEYPQYTRPSDFRGLKVPEVLLNGNHALIEEWKQKKALEETKKYRPDLLKQMEETTEE
jgi:tRNA (guanine37-N1)-methyltransferase